MSMQENTGRVLFGVREGIQTLGEVPQKGDMLEGSLKPPCGLVVARLKMMIGEDMVRDPNLLVELPPPGSSPSVTYMVHEVVSFADFVSSDVADRVAVHTMMTVSDFEQVVGVCGGRRVHLFGDASGLHARKYEVSDWLGTLSTIAENGVGRVSHVRASLEHATDTDPSKLQQFVSGIGKINKQWGRVITAIGIPDTNGLAYPDEYQRLIAAIGPTINENNLEVFIHLHNDGRRAIANAEAIIESLGQFGIPWVLETVHDDFPGERVGVGPRVRDLRYFGLTVPDSHKDVLSGSSWVSQGSEYDSVFRKLVQCGHVAGVHTNDMHAYNGFSPDKNYAAPGLYTIMGGTSLEKILQMLGRSPLPRELKKAGALVGRELSAQEGNLEQRWAIALALEASENADFILQTAKSFGDPKTWLSKPLPDLSGLRYRLGCRVDASFSHGLVAPSISGSL